MTDLEYLKSYLKDYAEANLARDKHKGLICPSCGSGTGKSGTSAFKIDPKTQSRQFKCFNCGISGDIFDILEHTEGIMDKTEQFKRINELYGGGDRGGSPRKAESARTRGNAREDFKDPIEANQEGQEREQRATFIKQSREALKNNPKALRYLEGRGITEETAARFNLGYSINGKYRDSLIIPYSEYYFTARPLYENPKSKYIKAGGHSPLFNIKALENPEAQPVFIVEGEIDTIILEQAGARALALGGKENTGKLLDWIKEKPLEVPLILWGDKDDPGRDMEGKLAKQLEELGAAFLIVAEDDKRQKDPGEELLADPGRLDEIIGRYITEANLLSIGAEEAERAEIEKESAANYLEEMFKGIAERQHIKPIITGFDNLDATLGGGLYTGLYFVGALSGLGKTTYTLQLADQLAESGQDILYFSLEMSREELIAKSLSRLTRSLSDKDKGLYKTELGITAGYRYNHYTEAEKSHILEVRDHYKDRIAGSLYIMEGVGAFGVPHVWARAEKHIRLTGRRPIVIIDYLQLLQNTTGRNNSTDKQIADHNVLELKQLARDLNLVVWVISSFNRENYHRKLNTGAFKESGAIEYTADVVIGLAYLEAEIAAVNAEGKLKDISISKLQKGKGKDIDNKRDIVLKVLKNRKGPSGGMIQYDYYPATNTIVERYPIDETGNRISEWE